MTAKRYLLLLIFIIGTFSALKTGHLYQKLSLNLANLYMLRWSFIPIGKQQDNYLPRAVFWGDQAGDLWPQVQRDRISAKLNAGNTGFALTSTRKSKVNFDEGQEYENQGDYQRALSFYRDACDAFGKNILACYHATKMADQLSQDSLAQQLINRIISLEPEHPLGPIDFEDLRLVGYDIDEGQLERSIEPVPLTLYWESSKSSLYVEVWKSSSWTFIKLGTRIFQVGEIRNLLPNGGFEQDLSRTAVLPYGYQNVVFAANQDEDILASRHRIDLSVRGRGQTQAAVVVNHQSILNGLTTRDGLEIKTGKIYLLSGWMKADQSAQGYLGGVWRTSDKADILYWKITPEETGSTWEVYDSVMEAPPESKYFTFLALNTGEAEVYFDNLIFVELELPLEME